MPARLYTCLVPQHCRLLCSALALVAALAAAPVAALGRPPVGSSAQPDEASRREAAEHFAKAEASERAGDYRAAIVEYQRAYELKPHASVLFNIGRNQE